MRMEGDVDDCRFVIVKNEDVDLEVEIERLDGS